LRTSNSKKQEQDEPSAQGGSNGLLRVENLTKRFGPHLVLDNISLAIQQGKTTVVIGPSGCGKTVLIKHLIVLLRPTSGEVYFKDRRIDNLAPTSGSFSRGEPCSTVSVYSRTSYFP